MPIYADKSRSSRRSLDLDDLDPNVVFQTSQKEVEDLKLETEETHFELDQMRLKLKDRETQLKSANEFLETVTNERVREREDDRLEILKLTQELKEERRSRNLEKAVIEELHEQVINYFIYNLNKRKIKADRKGQKDQVIQKIK